MAWIPGMSHWVSFFIAIFSWVAAHVERQRIRESARWQV